MDFMKGCKSGILLFSVVIFASQVHAGKPTRGDDGMFLGNNFPSGPHFNLILHGKRTDFTCVTEIKIVEVTLTGESVDPLHGIGDKYPPGGCPTDDDNYSYVCEFGNVVNMPRGSESIRLLMESGRSGPKKKDPDTGDVNPDKLQVTDACTGFTDNDPAIIRIPGDQQGYAVYGRVLGKPGDGGGPSFSVTGREIPVIGDTFGEAGEVWLAGTITGDGVFIPETCDDGNGGCTLTRWDSNTKGKGAKKATDISGLFNFNGSVCYWAVDEACFDSGIIDVGENVCDPTDFCCGEVTGLDGLGDVEVGGTLYTCRLFDVVEEDSCPNFALDPEKDINDVFVTYEDDNGSVEELWCKDFSDTWIFNIADFVNVFFDVNNEAYNVQIRLYPLPLQ